MITASQKAVDKLKELREGSDKKVLRVSVSGGGCSGLSYKMAWIDESEVNLDKDRLYKLGDEVKAVVDSRSNLYLAGSELDYSDGLDGQGFAWHNPNAARTCGCGASFST